MSRRRGEFVNRVVRQVHHTGETCENESGASLLLAVIFVMVISVSLAALLTLGGNDLLNTTNLRVERSLEYAAGSATDAAIQSVRYSYYAYSGGSGDVPPGLCLPNSATSIAINGDAMTVYCSGIENPNSASSRVVTFFACEGTPASGCTSNNAVLQADVIFDDWSLSTPSVHACAAGNKATCGTSDKTLSWTIENANS